MTSEERKAWAHSRLDEFLREHEIQQFLDAVADVTHLEDRVCDLERATEDHDRNLAQLTDDTHTLTDRLDDVDERMQEDAA